MVEDAIGAQRLDARVFMQELMYAAQGKPMATYRDKPSLWLTHHQITDRKSWDDKVMAGGCD